MSATVIVPLLDGRWLAMTREDFDAALAEGTRLMPAERPPEPTQGPDDGVQWLTVKAAAYRTSMSESFWRLEAKKPHVPTRYIGKSLRISAAYVADSNYQSGGQ
jgi:hypothetical protein